MDEGYLRRVPGYREGKRLGIGTVLPRRELGAEAASRAMLDPRAWVPIVWGVLLSLWAIVRKRGRAPAINPQGGRYGLPADFLISRDGRVLARKYGAHAYDQWSVDELLALAREGRVES
jgi:hypothetical protein